MTARRLALAVPLLALAACSEDGGGLVLTRGALQLEAPSVDFGPLQVGSSRERPYLAKNLGPGVLRITRVALAGTSTSAAFSVRCGDAPCEDRLIPAGGGLALTLGFAPTALGEARDSLVLETDSDTTPRGEVALSGRGLTAALAVDPREVVFGNVVVGSTKTLVVRIENTSEIDARVGFEAGDNVAFCGDPARSSAFCVAPTDRPLSADASFELPAGTTTRWTVQFDPALAGRAEAGVFGLRACASCPPITVSLSGQAIERGLVCTPPVLEMGAITPGACRERFVECENVANDPVAILSWGADTAATPPSSPAFVVEAFSGLRTLREGDTMRVGVRYCPTALGADEGVLAIETDSTDPARRFARVALRGTGGGPDVDVRPPVLDFGEVALIAPARRSLQIANIGVAELEITRIEVDTVATGAFTAPTQGRVVPVGGFYELEVEFRPRIEGPVRSNLILHTNDQDEPRIEVELVGVGVRLPSCEYQLVPAQLAFGVVQRGRSARRAVEIRNVGQGDCLVTNARVLTRSDDVFTLAETEVRSLRITPGSSQTVRTAFAPTQPVASSGTLELSISSETSPFAEVPLSGTGADSTLLIVPDELDFGSISVGCRARARLVTLYNTSAVPAVIQSIALEPPSNPAFELVRVPAPLPSRPLTLAPGASAELEVRFRADAIAAHASAVVIQATFDGRPADYRVSLEGRGDVNATQVDRFDQLGQPKVDMMMVVDDSASMTQEQISLGDNFGAFIQFANAQSLDYQIAVTTTDVSGNGPGGRFVPLTGDVTQRVVRPQTQPSPEDVFVRNVAVGSNGSGTEQGLQAAFLALSSPLLFGHNAGFLRPDAVLSIVFVSDEADQSPSSLDFYANFFYAIKGFRNANLLSVSAIVGPPEGCTGPGGSAQYGARYTELAERTGGLVQSICTDDWSAALQRLSRTAFGLKSRFFLSNQPVPSTMRVTIDGVPMPARSMEGTLNWEYDPEVNSLNFTPLSAPEPGGQIEVSYTVECL